jgi:hypothetical protein
MSKHDAEYFRQRRRARGIPVREMLTAPNFLQQATEPRGVEQLPWPGNLFGEPASIGTDSGCWSPPMASPAARPNSNQTTKRRPR